MSTFKDKIKSRPEKSVLVCLDAALINRLQVARQEREAADAASGVNPSAAWKRADKAVTELEEAVRQNSTEFTFRALPRREWAELVGKHAPRKNNQTDRLLGYDGDAVAWDAAIAGTISPELDDEDWTAFDENLSAGQWEPIKRAVLFVNAGQVDIPF